QLGITGSWDAGTGVLTLTGVASAASYQTALRSVLFHNSSQAPSTLTRVIEIIASDGSDAGTPATRNLLVTAVADAPIVTTSAGAIVYTEGDPALLVDPGVSFADIDSSTFASATIRITTGYAAGQDLLAFTNQLGITGSWDASTGTLTLT